MIFPFDELSVEGDTVPSPSVINSAASLPSIPRAPSSSAMEEVVVGEQDNDDAQVEDLRRSLSNLQIREVANKVDNNTQHEVAENTNMDGPQVMKTYEETFMKQVENLSGKRKRNGPQTRLVETMNSVEEECNLVESLTSNILEPNTIHDALNCEHSSQWKEALRSEYESLIKNKTWDLVPRPKNTNIVGNRWVFKEKRNSDGSIDRFKARFCAQGFTQTHGVDYEEVYSPVARMTSIRSLLALANAHDLEVHQMDVRTAFLNGELEHEVYMEQPEGFEDSCAN